MNKIKSGVNMKNKKHDHVSQFLSSCCDYFLICCKLDKVPVALFMLDEGVRIRSKLYAASRPATLIFFINFVWPTKIF